MIATFATALLSGDRARCRGMVDRLRAQGTDALGVYDELFRPALVEVGDRWQRNEISVAREHVATAIVEQLMGELFEEFAGTRRVGRTALIAGVEGELHQVGARMVADVFEGAGWDARFVGAGVPSDDLFRLIETEQPSLVALSMAMPWNRRAMEQTVEELVQRSVPVVYGGCAFSDTNTSIAGLRPMTLKELHAWLHA